MKIDTTKISGFDSMSAEEKLTALLALELEEPKGNEEEVGKYKSAFDKTASEVARLKKELNEKRTEAERLEAERKENQEKLEAELKDLRRGKMISEYTNQFLANGYSAELAKSSAEAMSDGNMSVVFNDLAKVLKSNAAKVKEELLSGTPKPSGGDTEKTVTKEQFDGMSYTERVALKNDNPELFQELNK